MNTTCFIIILKSKGNINDIFICIFNTSITNYNTLGSNIVNALQITSSWRSVTRLRTRISWGTSGVDFFFFRNKGRSAYMINVNNQDLPSTRNEHIEMLQQKQKSLFLKHFQYKLSFLSNHFQTILIISFPLTP